MTAQEIRQALAHGEHLTLECKRAENELPKSIWETYSAFANTMGGLILLGIEEKVHAKDLAERFVVRGVSNADKLITDFWNIINSNKVNKNILLHEHVGKVTMPDGAVVVYIRVPQADWRIKPIYLNENVYKYSFRRNHEGDYHCSEGDIKAMIRDTNEDGNDGVLLEGFTMDDIDIETLRGYRVLFRTVNADHIWNDYENVRFLRNLGGYAVDRVSGKEGLTAAGLLMFGKGLSIRERFANFRMDYLDMSRLTGEERYRDRLTYDGRWENNLYQFFRIVMQKLTFDMPRPFHMEGIQRIDDTPQIHAIREALTNAIIHADVFLNSGILRIEKHDDRLCLRNPGTLKLPIEDILEGGNSKARNPRIQTMLRMIGYGENIGSGFPKIVAAWKQAGWNMPILENKIDLGEVWLTLVYPKEEIQSDTNVIQTDTNSLLEEIFTHIKNNPHITRKELIGLTNKSSATVQRYTDALQRANRIKRIGTYGGYWEIIEETNGDSL